MPPRLLAPLLLLLPAMGCAPKAVDDSATPLDTQADTNTSDDFSCPTPEIHVNGNEPPTVGDYWEVLLWCDNTLMTGAMHMSIAPPEMATIEDNTLTWNLAGTGTLSVQVGTIEATEDVTVSEAP